MVYTCIYKEGNDRPTSLTPLTKQGINIQPKTKDNTDKPCRCEIGLTHCNNILGIRL